ncbi:MAG: class I SAM-dependent methyltransferase [Chloroflexota bacterium]
MPRDWDAATYDRIADPQLEWGLSVVDRLPLTGSERVLDAGCGSGRVTEALLDRLPDGQVIALDGSPSMVAEARRRLAGFGDRVVFVVADLLAPLPVERAVDAILSTATFHWILDHDRLFANLARAMRPGARLAAQCGGRGNIDSAMRALEQMGEPTAGKLFAGPEETESRLRAAGFTDVRCWLEAKPRHWPDDESFETFLRTVVLGDNIANKAPDDADAFVHEVAHRIGSRELDYVRLNIDATRG